METNHARGQKRQRNMHSDFSALGKSAKALIPVPKVPMDAIRGRARAATRQARLRAIIACGAIALIVLGAGTGLGARFYDGVRVWLSGGKAALTIHSFVMVREPTASDLQRVVARATFPIVFPVGVPAGSRMTMLIFAPAQRPNFVEVSYHNGPANFNVGFSLIDAAAINTDESTLPADSWRRPSAADYQWRVGRETVWAPKFAHISLSDLNRIEAAMMKASPASSVALTEATLRKITVLGVRPELADVAERHAPASGRSVLLDPPLTRRIPTLAQQGEPVVDDRIIYLTNIPLLNGQPDYTKATLHWPRIIVVPVTGVRAIDAVLRFTRSAANCGCAILFSQARNARYLISELPLSAPSNVQKFSVDAKSFAVVRLK
jgi:hypothetical protein